MSGNIKAFISHSSKDKPLVSEIFRKLSAAQAHYDEATFEKGETSASEIFQAMAETDVFALFLSKNSITSKWVQTELKLAQQRLYSGKIKKFLIFIIDDLDNSEIPEWTTDYIYQRSKSPGVIATSIRSALFEVKLAQNSEISLFMGRDKELGAIKEDLSDLSNDAPLALFLTGSDGIGRRTLAKRALRDVHPQLIALPLEVTLGDTESEIELYRSLLNQAEHLTILESIQRLETFTGLNLEHRAKLISDTIEKITSQRQIIFLRGKDSIIRDDGYLPDWLNLVLKNLTPSPWPKLVVIARRMIPASRRGNYPSAKFYPINSLESSASKKLLAIWLKHHGANIEQNLSDEISTYVSGHPRNIQIAAALAAEFGSPRLIAQRADFLETIRQQARGLIDSIKVTPEREKLLALFREYEYLSAEDLFVAINSSDESELGSTIAYLSDHGIIETDGPYLRIAPYLLDALSRYDWSEEARDFVIECRSRVLSRVDSLTTDDFVSISTIDTWIVSMLRTNQSVDNMMLARCLLPSHLLKVAREFYDRKEFSKTIELAKKAFEGRGKLSTDAQIESLRLICLSSVRLGSDDDLFEAIDQLEKYGSRLSERTASFVRGFKARYEGNIDTAETQFRAAYSLDGQKNFHILRELAQILKLKEEHSEAESFARAAKEIGSRNPYIIDTLLEIIIERNKDNKKFLREDAEIQILFTTLEETARREKRSFYESRMAHYYACLHDPAEAVLWAEKAVETTPFHVPVLLNLARIQIDIGDTVGAKRTLE